MARTLRFAVVLVFCWLATVLYGALLLETFVFYPDFFHDVPRSLTLTREFMTPVKPGNFFRPVGMATTAFALAAVVAAWRVAAARYLFAATLALLGLGEGVYSALFFWPKWTILMTEGAAVHPAGYLQEVADRLQAWHWLRVGAFTLAVACVFAGLLAFYRDRVTTAPRR